MSTSDPIDESSSHDRPGAIPAGDFEKRVTLTSGRTITFPEWFVFVNGCTPLILLGWDARMHQLGPDPIDNALRTSGMLAVVALIATLTITPLRKITGWNALFYFRRPLGLLSFLYAFMHAGIYVAHDRAGDLADAWNEIIQRRYLQIGAVALAVLALLTVTSTPRMVRWLGFGWWKRVHRLIYLAAILAIVHQYLQTRADTTRPVVLGVVLAGLLGYRTVGRFGVGRRQREAAAPDAIGGYRIEVVGQSVQAISDGSQPILDAAETVGIELPADCRSGVCGACRVRLISGAVEMDITEGLLAADRDNSIVLACQAICQSDVTIEPIKAN